ncbi:IS1634 family transposase [Thermospira aquatica]|uniref:IS1634 family transposase n=1 Tax=Thermospira aquatica TaxID=2828656 RepID=A0AAX3BC40_9SPIR|nr:IS1634 family transposase [Thermospira aquatica]URA09663.1 IS1634 family transposase [Thermospira aquatica]
MFVKPISIPNRKTGKRYTYYRLCESYRLGNTVRHRNILNLGKLEELPDRSDHKVLADRIEQIVYKRPSLFVSQIPQKIENLAQHYASIIIQKGLLDIPKESLVSTEAADEGSHDYQEVDVNSLEHNDAREVGAEWLCRQALEELGLSRYLGELGWEERWIKMAMIYITARAVFPASEHKTEEWLKENSGLSELYGVEPGRVSRHHLYKVSRKLYQAKEEIDRWMARRTGELFTPQDKIILYDLTNLYFEGEKRDSEKARFGRSKERRNDAKLMALGLVTDTMGFIRYSHIYEGNIRDSKTLKKTIKDMEERYPSEGHCPVIVIDAGIATEENLRMLREQKRDYVCVSLAKMKDRHIAEIEEKGRRLTDRRGNEIVAQWVEVEGYEDRFLYIKSKGRRSKSRAWKRNSQRGMKRG